MDWGEAEGFNAEGFKHRPQNGTTFFLKFILYCTLHIPPVHIYLTHESTINQATQTIQDLMVYII